jgi:hypothetical protein
VEGKGGSGWGVGVGWGGGTGYQEKGSEWHGAAWPAPETRPRLLQRPFGRRAPRPCRPLLPAPKVDEPMRANAGGGIDGHGEAIEVLALPFDAAAAFVLDPACPKSPGLMFGLTWAAAGLRSGQLKGRAGTLETDPLELRSVLPS